MKSLSGAVLGVLIAGCAELPPGSRAARTLAEQAIYPHGAWPITSTFRDSHDSRGMRRRGGHAGVDIRVPPGTPVLAAAAGTVRVVEDPGAGTVILLEVSDGDGPLLLEFAHLAEVRVSSGAQVARGQVVGVAGRSGSESGGVVHLHFAAAPVGSDVVDPVPLLFGTTGAVCARPGPGDPARGWRSLSPASRPQLLYPVACTRSGPGKRGHA